MAIIEIANMDINKVDKELLESKPKTEQKIDIKTNKIKLLSTNPHFYKTFTFNNEVISVYINVKKIEEYCLL